MRFQGRVWRFGDNVDTDVIIPGKYLKLSTEEAAAHVMEGIDPEFPRKVRPGDIVVAGRNFGCGSSRETAPHALKLAGVSVVVAESFARIFYRNAFNLGLPVVECDGASAIAEGDSLEVDLEAGSLIDLTTGARFAIKPFPPHLLEMLQAGGLVPYLAQRFPISQ